MSEDRSKDKVAVNVRGVPRGVRQRFRARCDLKGVTMREEIIAFMQKVVVQK